PDGFETWGAKKQADYLIDALEDVDARQTSSLHRLDLVSDPRIEALIRLGDPAVPALIDALESDERLTRSIYSWQHSHQWGSTPYTTVLGVREAVLTALMSILRMQVYDSAGPFTHKGEFFPDRVEEAARDMAERLRAYWKEHGGLPIDERMMKVLTDPKTT